jgi:hypothetical protein
MRATIVEGETANYRSQAASAAQYQKISGNAINKFQTYGLGATGSA